LGGIEANHGHTSTLSIATISHLFERIEQVATGDWNLTGQTNDAATALG
jgi:hypothetical protein